jgi:DNA-binding NarL/FixJ family response regulator
MRDSHSAIIASPHALEAASIGTVISAHGWTVLAQPTTAVGLFRALESERPDIVILDGCLVGPHASVVDDLNRRGLAVMLLEGPERSGAMILEGLAAGARGCLCMDEPPEEFLASLRLAIHGSLVLYRRAKDLVFEEILASARVREDLPLTPQQRRVAALVATGASNAEIAAALGISEHTVKVHLSSILGKLGLENRQQLAVYVVRSGLAHSPASAI